MSVEFKFRPIERWPQEPTPSYLQRHAHFRVPYNKTLQLLSYELEKIGAKTAWLQVDVTERDIRNDGAIRTDSQPKTSRVIVSAQSKHGPISLPCDTYRDWRDNLRAVALSLEALRSVDRHGVTKRGEQYRGLKQLTAGDGPINSHEAARLIAKHRGGNMTASLVYSSLETAESCYREVAKFLHPDKGGDVSEWNKLQAAIAILREHHGAKS